MTFTCCVTWTGTKSCGSTSPEDWESSCSDVCMRCRTLRTAAKRSLSSATWETTRLHQHVARGDDVSVDGLRHTPDTCSHNQRLEIRSEHLGHLHDAAVYLYS
ncbi:hypothetical protein C0Q70_16202 [Pomacea canaliculata]|uniref:Uncharacterized protein n=1 Tax=Pomacea canaliculata TaxID=400727 RepID=A0A2T7NP64_POMCA|nr:hypothetical protein C0Q70_16202 [Pomacea canaliculata]